MLRKRHVTAAFDAFVAHVQVFVFIIEVTIYLGSSTRSRDLGVCLVQFN